MHFEKRYKEALQHLERASAFLRGPELRVGENGTREEEMKEEMEPGRRAVLEHIAAARRELKGLQEKRQQEESLQGDLQKNGAARRPHEKNGTGRPTTSKLASQSMGLLSILLGQIGKTKKALEPLRPSGDRRPPLQRLRETDLEAVLSALRRLRRPASAMEASLRRLSNRLREGGAQST